MKCPVRMSLICALCLLGTSVLVGQTQQSYLLRSDGYVQVNGVPVPKTSVVLPGDVVETYKGSMAKIASPGMSMLVGENSRISVKSGTLAIDKGSASIASSAGTSIGAAQYSISPTGSSPAKYQVASSGQSVSVLSSNGPLSVTSSSGITKVLSGQTAVISAGSSALGMTTTALVDSSSANFSQLDDLEASRTCRKATLLKCFCKTAKQCSLE